MDAVIKVCLQCMSVSEVMPASEGSTYSLYTPEVTISYFANYLIMRKRKDCSLKVFNSRVVEMCNACK